MIGDVHEVRIWNQLAEQAGILVVHYRVTAETDGGSNQQGIANAIGAAVAVPMKNCMVTEATHRGVGVRKIFPLPQGVEAVSTTGAGAGMSIAPALPRQVAGVLTKRTGLPGKSFRGRCYVPFPSEDLNVAEGTPAAGYIGLIAALGAAFLTPINAVSTAPPGTSTLVHVVWSRLTLSSPQVISFVARPRWGTQRRRGSYGRSNVPPF